MPVSHFDESDLRALETAYRRLVAELGIPAADAVARLRVAQLVMNVAKVEAVIVPSQIESEAARRFRAELEAGAGSVMPLISSYDVLAGLLDPSKRSL